MTSLHKRQAGLELMLAGECHSRVNQARPVHHDDIPRLVTVVHSQAQELHLFSPDVLQPAQVGY